MQTFFRPLTCLKLLSVNSRALAYNRQFHIASFQKAARKEKQDSSLAENNQRIQSDQLSLRGKGEDYQALKQSVDDIYVYIMY